MDKKKENLFGGGDWTGEAINYIFVLKFVREEKFSYKEVFLPVSVIMMRTANMSGYCANIPGAFMDMYSLQNCSMRLPTNSSKVALHARATLEVPETEKDQLRWILWVSVLFVVL